MVFSPAHRPSAPTVAQSVHSPIGRSPNPHERGAAGQSNVTHLSVHGCISVGLGRNLRVSRSGRRLACPRDHAYKRIGVSHCVESNPTLCPNVNKSTCNDSHGQQGDSSIHQSPRGRALSAAAEHSETLCWTHTHLLSIRAVYIPGVLNRGADIMSRGDPVQETGLCTTI